MFSSASLAAGHRDRRVLGDSGVWDALCLVKTRLRVLTYLVMKDLEQRVEQLERGRIPTPPHRAVTLGWKIFEADVDQWVLVIDDQVLPHSGSGSVRGVVSSEEVSQLVGPWGPEGAPAAATKPRLRRLSGSTAHG